MHIRTLLAALLLAGLLSSHAKARIFSPPTSEELAQQAPIICNGRVLSLTNTLAKGNVGLAGANPSYGVPVEYWIAKVQVLGTTKGSLPSEINFRFPQIDQHPANGEMTAIMDGPIQFTFNVGKRYRFYLKDVPGQTYYVGVLDGQFDDGFAAQPLTDIEPDTSGLPLSRDAAIEAADAYVAKFKPNADDAEGSPYAEERNGKWTVAFYWTPGRAPMMMPDASISIVGAGLIDPATWVSDGTHPKLRDLTPRDIGSELQIGLNMALKNNTLYDTDYPSALILRGRFAATSEAGLQLSGVTRWQTPQTWPTLTIPPADISEISRLIPTSVPSPTPAH